MVADLYYGHQAIEDAPMVSRVLRLRAVRDRTALSRSSLYARIKQGEFPRQIKIGPRAVGWLEHEVEA